MSGNGMTMAIMFVKAHPANLVFLIFIMLGKLKFCIFSQPNREEDAYGAYRINGWYLKGRRKQEQADLLPVNRSIDTSFTQYIPHIFTGHRYKLESQSN